MFMYIDGQGVWHTFRGAASLTKYLEAGMAAYEDGLVTLEQSDRKRRTELLNELKGFLKRVAEEPTYMVPRPGQYDVPRWSIRISGGGQVYGLHQPVSAG